MEPLDQAEGSKTELLIVHLDKIDLAFRSTKTIIYDVMYIITRNVIVKNS